MGFSVDTEKWCGESVWVLSGTEGAHATILPAVGANLIELTLPGPDKASIQVIALPKDIQQLQDAPTHYGAPVLYPFPSRMAQGRFSFSGNQYQLDVRPDGNSLHGFVFARAFTVSGYGAGTDGAWVSCTYDGNNAEIQHQFPFPFNVTLTFHLDAEGLSVDVAGMNTGGTKMPMGFGWHPYFNLPLMANSDRSKCLLQVPTNKYWELSPDLVPTGRRLAVFGRLDMREGLVVGENTYDDILTGVIRDEYNWSHASVIDTVGNVKVTLSAGPSFREWVIYTPPGRPAICLEPYTCTGNSFNLQDAGVDAGVMTLAPGESWNDKMRISLHRI